MKSAVLTVFTADTFTVEGQTTNGVIVKFCSTEQGSAIALRGEHVMTSKCSHTNVVTVLETMVDNDRGPHADTVLVFPQYAGGTLAQLCTGPEGGMQLEGSGSDTFFKVLKVFVGVVQGLQHLHKQEQEVVHNNLHPGCLCIYDEGQMVIGGLGHGSLQAPATPRVDGIACYKAPEVLNAGRIGAMYKAQKAQNVWSLAIIIFELMCGRPVDWAPENAPAVDGCSVEFFKGWGDASLEIEYAHLLAK